MSSQNGDLDGTVVEWLQSALEDVRIARRCLLDPPAARGLFYHVQQAAEKALKAYLLALGAPDVLRTHRLRDLTRQIVALGGNPPDADVVRYLDTYSVGVRYPDTYVPPLEQADAALDHVIALIQHVLDQLGLPGPGDETSQMKLKW